MEARDLQAYHENKEVRKHPNAVENVFFLASLLELEGLKMLLGFSGHVGRIVS